MATALDPSDGSKSRAIPRIGLGALARRMFEDDRRDMRGMLRRMYDDHGTVVLQKLGPVTMVNLFGPDANRLVLMDRERIFSARKPWMTIMGRIFPNGLLLRDGEEHKHHRKIMHTAFKRPALRDYEARMNPMIERGIAGWQGEMKAFPAFKTLTLDIAASIFLGEELGPKTQRMNGAFEDLVAASMSRIRLPLPGLEFNRGLQARRFMVKYLGERIAERRANPGEDMFSRLCRAETEEGERFSDADVIDHMSFLMMAAHDTTTSTLTSMVYELCRNPEWQERVREESQQLGDAPLRFDQLDAVPLLGRVMKETLRLYPPLPIIPRAALRSFEFSGYEVPEGAMVVISPIVTHRMEEWWSAPDDFDPDRFSEERAEHERHTHSYVPFGGGAHMCIGLRFAELQVKAIVTQLLRRLRFSIEPGYVMPVQQAPISKPVDGLPIRVERLV